MKSKILCLIAIIGIMVASCEKEPLIYDSSVAPESRTLIRTPREAVDAVTVVNAVGINDDGAIRE